MFKKFVCLCIFCFVNCFCFARQISFQIVQYNDILTEVSEESLIIEDKILQLLFSKGFIVTNSTASISKSVNDDESLYLSGIKEAFEGSSDYFIQIKLYFKNIVQETKTKNVLTKVDWVLARANTGTKISQNSVENPTDISMLILEEINKFTK